MGYLLLVLALAVLMLLWSLISPRSQWRILKSWTYRNPEANEPSDAAYGLTRIGALVGLLVLFGGFWYLWQSENERRAAMEEWIAKSEANPFTTVWPAEPSEVFVVDDIEQLDSAIGSGSKSEDAAGESTVEIGAYAVLDGDSAYLRSLPPRELHKIPPEADLLVSVESPSVVPTRVRVVENSVSVMVTLLDDCASSKRSEESSSSPEADKCDGDAAVRSQSLVLVPIDLEQPLGKRTLMDDSQDVLVPVVVDEPQP